MKKNKKNAEIFTIIDGKHIECWGDTDGWTFLTFRENGVTLSFPPIDQKKIFGELLEISGTLVDAMSKIKKKK